MVVNRFRRRHSGGAVLCVYFFFSFARLAVEVCSRQCDFVPKSCLTVQQVRSADDVNIQVVEESEVSHASQDNQRLYFFVAACCMNIFLRA